MITTITREWLRAQRACWSDEKIARFVPEEGISVLADAPKGVPIKDVIWVLLYILPRKERTLLVCGWAEQACEIAGHTDERSIRAITLARAYVHDKCSREKLEKAHKAAHKAATEAATEAAANAAWAAAHVSLTAVWATAYATHTSTAAATARRTGVPVEQQVDDLRRVIGKLVKKQTSSELFETLMAAREVVSAPNGWTSAPHTIGAVGKRDLLEAVASVSGVNCKMYYPTLGALAKELTWPVPVTGSINQVVDFAFSDTTTQLDVVELIERAAHKELIRIREAQS